ncbi:hypothetical protein R6Q57_018663 [Mikania cordata]
MMLSRVCTMPKRGGKAAHDQAFRPSSKVIIKFLMVLQKHGDLLGVQKVLNLNLWVSFLLQAKKMYSNKQGLSIVGYACTTCIGNSRDLDESIAATISANGGFPSCVFANSSPFRNYLQLPTSGFDRVISDLYVAETNRHMAVTTRETSGVRTVASTYLGIMV